jgi:amidohydrolase
MLATTADVQPQPTPEIAKLKTELVELRRDFHQYPELAFEEVRTSNIVAKYLSSLGLEPKTGIAKTGVTADIVGDLPGPTILLRADMDALPIKEETGLPFTSTVDGKMHACGHDGHTAILLVTAKKLVQNRQQLRGTVRVLFQPAEEGPGGAAPMISEGVLEGVDAALGLHLWLHLPTGQLNFCAGPMLAASDEFDVTVLGVGTHAASPQMGIDPITTACHMVTGAQALLSRGVDPKEPCVFSVTSLKAGSAYNVVPSTATFGGTLRTYDEEVRADFKERFDRYCRSTAQAYGATAEIEWREGYPVLINDPRIAALCEEACGEFFHMKPAEERPDARSLGGEDMSFYLQEVPGCFLFLGAYNEDIEARYNHHHPKFTIDEDALPMGVELFLRCVEKLSLELPLS